MIFEVVDQGGDVFEGFLAVETVEVEDVGRRLADRKVISELGNAFGAESAILKNK